MKAGFWIAPEGADSVVTLLPVGAERDRRPGALLAGRDGADTIARCPRVAALVPLLVEALAAQTADRPGRLFDLAGLDETELKLIADVIGEGEVAATVALPDGVVAQICEAVMAGLWRVRFVDAEGRPLADYLEVGAIPEAVRRAAAMTAPAIAVGAPPAGAMNALPVLAEIRERMTAWRPGAPNHTITFSLLPMSPDDMAFLQATLGDGPVRIVSSGYGSCRVLATGARHVWSVQFFNAADEIVLDTLEIGDVPAAACAAADDFRDSAARLRQIEEAYFR
ncbi:hydrogenase expression/formation C-terminal domain-containing protein [Rhodoplanes sp. TEM]|uniref:Hydrogenase expression/formation C-terminal domain-containing protein n=1 Tax=Rhodoplanes tepidamans TaxID=200616 RepID=A0ABT5JBG0_RHOTP|nr:MULTISPECIES: hydrogenase expression/formation protein [Rhodoplanes]MDC7787000.1 hydrogenase expression/formation C-terminal domain-containing protein [Rhodoplanes tepidamans]MDC7987008.1 hydrogenase expression/formation C-terminal domain-containing protein [Rhodoplanes sp. TEM]MDQ0354275.1 hydrogenase-1 operon protein HyaF [Rhodoplanes tepidamans]